MKIKKGSVIREYKYGHCIQSTVITDPIENERGQLEFKAETSIGSIIEYMKNESSLDIIKE
jgi:hypothetical protein